MGQLTRRRLLRLASGGLALAATRFQSPELSDARAGARRVVDVAGRAQHIASTIAAGNDSDFTALFVSWNGPPRHIPEIEIAIQDAGGAWSDWTLLHQDHHVPVDPDGPVYFNPVLRQGSAFELRTPNSDDAALIDVQSVDASQMAGTTLLGEVDVDGAAELIDGFIIPRAAWGANESFRFNGQDPANGIGWPPEYQEIQHVVVHHTETEFGYDDPAAVVRSIYYYHAVVLDWADIGYNFLIDAYGNVYEGRYGGPGVVGGHALDYNGGSLGIALVGSYGDTPPTQEALDALVRLIRTRASDVDPTAAADWIEWAGVPNICGHGDIINTACPGADLFAVLASVRGRVAGGPPIHLPAPVRLYDPQIVSFDVGPSLVDPEGLLEVRATVTQKGREPLHTQGPDPGFTYDEGEDYDTAGYPKVEGRFRLAIEISGTDDDSELPNPYRWGFGQTLHQGEEREIVGYVRVGATGARRIEPSIVHEFVRYYEGEAAPETVYVVHPLVSRASELAGIDTVYMPETGHNVPRAFYEYWASHGGLNRFGFPLTEPFDEASETDGQLYLTQYFERGRFEYHPELEFKNEAVKLGLLGAEVTAARSGEQPFQPIEPIESTAEVHYFPETQHSTSYRFLQTWTEQGGVETFGYPVSEKFEETSRTDGRIRLVQYFERARFEYHPDDVWDKQIKLGHLGREILIDRGWLPGPSATT